MKLSALPHQNVNLAMEESIPVSQSISFLDGSGHVICFGYLEKLGRIIPNWKRRMFILCTDLILRYYKEENDRWIPAGSIDVSRGTITEKPTNEARKFRFDIYTSGRTMVLLAPNDETRTRWLDSLGRTLSGKSIALIKEYNGSTWDSNANNSFLTSFPTLQGPMPTEVLFDIKTEIRERRGIAIDELRLLIAYSHMLARPAVVIECDVIKRMQGEERKESDLNGADSGNEGRQIIVVWFQRPDNVADARRVLRKAKEEIL